MITYKDPSGSRPDKKVTRQFVDDTNTEMHMVSITYVYFILFYFEYILIPIDA